MKDTTHNTGLAKVAVLCPADTFEVNQKLVLRINICGENRHLRQARNRYDQYELTKINTYCMKKSLLIFILFFGIQSFSQNVILKETELTKLLCKKWKLKYGEMNGQKVSGLEIVDDEYEFKADKTYTLGSLKSSYVKGTWKYNAEIKRIELYSEEKSSSGYIKAINQNELILIPGEKSVPENFNLEFHFEPSL